jgi:hypothetical protein
MKQIGALLLPGRLSSWQLSLFFSSTMDRKETNIKPPLEPPLPSFNTAKAHYHGHMPVFREKEKKKSINPPSNNNPKSQTC